ncbi:MAG: HEAT repeat domain-containing protein [Proteobacteria bacterium]|nr:HEAT repeat domain-containing protein [Pseudomonadota bacterium]
MDGKQSSEEDIIEFAQLIADDLEGGELEKVTSLFRYNKTLYATVDRLVKDDRMRVRLGANIILDDLRLEKPDDVKLAIPCLLPLLQDESPTIRGDAADLIAMVGGREYIDVIRPLLHDPNRQVVEIVKDAIDEIQTGKT